MNSTSWWAMLLQRIIGMASFVFRQRRRTNVDTDPTLLKETREQQDARLERIKQEWIARDRALSYADSHTDIDRVLFPRETDGTDRGSPGDGNSR